jgi:hypothetical protein
MITITTEGPAILVGYQYHLRLEAEAPLFPTGALFTGHMRAKPSDAQLLAVISSADGGVVRVDDHVIDLTLSPTQTAGLIPGRVVLDLVRIDLEPDLHLGFSLELPVLLPITRGLP